jgi:hypothetical protein
MKFMHIVSALSLAALVLGAPEAIPEEKRQGVWPLDGIHPLGTNLVDFYAVVGDVTSFAGDVTSAGMSYWLLKRLSRIPDL